MAPVVTDDSSEREPPESPSQNGTVRSGWLAGNIPSADRLQRLTIGGLLMALSLAGLMDGFDWKRIIALALQAELLTTGLLGWCPFYWACRVR